MREELAVEASRVDSQITVSFTADGDKAPKPSVSCRLYFYQIGKAITSCRRGAGTTVDGFGVNLRGLFKASCLRCWVLYHREEDDDMLYMHVPFISLMLLSSPDCSFPPLSVTLISSLFSSHPLTVTLVPSAVTPVPSRFLSSPTVPFVTLLLLSSPHCHLCLFTVNFVPSLLLLSLHC